MESKTAKLKRMIKEAKEYQTSLYQELEKSENPQQQRIALIAEAKASALDDVLHAMEGNTVYLYMLSTGGEPHWK